MYEIKRMILNGNAGMFDTYIVYLI